MKISSCDYRQHSRVSRLQVWKQMHSWAIVAYVDKLMVRVTSARSREKKVLKDKLLF